MSSDMTMMIRLHPVSGIEMPGIGGTELLHKDCNERPDLDLHYKSSPDDAGRCANQRPSIVTLGKNSLTMIADPTLPRNAVDVVVELSDDVNDATPANEQLEGMGLALRDTIRLLSDSSTFSFEPTPSSMEESPTTSEKHPKLRLRIQRYIAGFVAINNEVVKTPNAIIKEGDILSLQSMSYSYDYVVMVTPISDSITNAATKTDRSNNMPLSVSPSDQDLNETVTMPPCSAAVTNNDQQQVYMELVDEQQKLMQQMVNDEFTCAICLEYQVQSTALVPCGHSFCHTCIFDPIKKKLMHKVCSVCNTKITAVVPNRTIDSCFHLIVQFQSEQNKKQPDDEPTSSSLASILPQEDFDHYKVRSEEQTNVRMNAKTNRPSKRPRPTHHRAPRMPPVPPPHLNNHGELFRALAFFPNNAMQGAHMDDDEDDNEMHADALQYFANRLFPPQLFPPQTPATATNQGQQPATASLVHGTTPSDAIEID